MNPILHGLSKVDFPPLAEVRKSLRMKWYRCPIERAKLRELAQPSDFRGLFQALGHLLIWSATGLASYYFFTQQLWWGFGLALVLHGIVTSFLTASHHELCHTTVFKTKWVNEFFLRIFSLLGWFNFHVYKHSHTYHHRFTLHLEGDREVVPPEKPSLQILYMLQLFTVNITGGLQSQGFIPTLRGFVHIASNRLDNPMYEWGPELYAGQTEEQAKAVRWARWVLLFHAAVIVISIGIGEPILAVLISGGIFISNWHRYFVGVPMHCGLRSNVPDFRKCVRTITLDPITEFLYWHMNWHLEHHMFVAVPCYNLKKLHRVLADDMPETRTLVGAWKEMRETWKRQQADPDYEYDTPVPTTAVKDRGDADPLAASMGGISPPSWSV